MAGLDSAFNAYIEGLQAFERNEFRTATDLFTLAWRKYPDWGLAKFWLSNAHRWTGTGTPHSEIDLQAVRASHADELPDLQRMVIDAQLAPGQEERHELYRQAIEKYPNVGYAAFLYGDELLMRGPHVGVPLEAAVTQLESAVLKKPDFGPAQCQLTWGNIRLGRREQSERSALACLEVSAGAGETDVDQGPLMQLLVAQRFSPEQADAVMGEMLADPHILETVGSYVRLLAMYDLAQLQSELSGHFLLSMPVSDDLKRGHFLEGRGLALIGLGQIGEGLTHIDQAAGLFGSPDAQLEAAEWRVVGHALKLPGISEQMLADGRSRLRLLLANPQARARAAWALGIAAARDGNLMAAESWLDSLSLSQSDSVAIRLTTLLEAIIRGSGVDPSEALRLSDQVMPFDSAGRGGDPFARAVLHLKRAEWLDMLDRPEEADAARLWYEQFEWLDAFPTGEAQAAEIDWALSTYARWLRGTTSRHGRNGRACAWLNRVLELWAGADKAYDPPRDMAADLVAQWCRQ
jgi:tetratricopeptide (TPR) repeat protein